eukprot:evm.model.scf_226EXC.5 EVM.evm.TU.scf_226EXC.5   scf_226EXC:37593-42215(-)
MVIIRGYITDQKRWGWLHPPPPSRYSNCGTPCKTPQKKQGKWAASASQRLLREFKCVLCKGVLREPISTPCGHIFCKGCVQHQFQGMGDTIDRNDTNGRALRTKKVIKPCPMCRLDIADFLRTAQVNRELASAICRLKEAVERSRRKEANSGATSGHEQEGRGEREEPDETSSLNNESEICDNNAKPLRKSQKRNSTDQQRSPARGQARPTSCASPSRPRAGASLRSIASEASELDNQSLNALCSQFSEFDKSLIEGLLEDQGGDVDDVIFALKKLRRQQKVIDKVDLLSSGTPTDKPPLKGRKRPSSSASPATQQRKKCKEDVHETRRSSRLRVQVLKAGEKSISVRTPTRGCQSNTGRDNSSCQRQRAKEELTVRETRQSSALKKADQTEHGKGNRHSYDRSGVQGLGYQSKTGNGSPLLWRPKGGNECIGWKTRQANAHKNGDTHAKEECTVRETRPSRACTTPGKNSRKTTSGAISGTTPTKNRRRDSWQGSQGSRRKRQREQVPVLESRHSRSREGTRRERLRSSSLGPSPVHKATSGPKRLKH